MLTLGALLLIALLGGAHRFGVRAFRPDRRERDEALEIRA